MRWSSFARDPAMIAPEDALPGRDAPWFDLPPHDVNGTSLRPPWPEGAEVAELAMGCFWGAERLFWRLPGVLTTAVGYSGGFTPHPSYREVCSGLTGHTESVLVVFDPAKVGYDELLRVFWEGHDPTQGMRQGNDVGTQYRSAVFAHGDRQLAAAEDSRRRFQEVLDEAGHRTITTEIRPAGTFYHAEPEHQQYLSKHPAGYCGLGGTGVSCPIGLTSAE
jgi:peptide-methionine (S)-S-oxide reductase